MRIRNGQNKPDMHKNPKIKMKTQATEISEIFSNLLQKSYHVKLQTEKQGKQK